MNNELSILDSWKISLGIFFPREKVFNINGINIHLILFKEKLNKMGQLGLIIVDEPLSAEGFIWVDNGFNKKSHCIIYRAKNMNRSHKGFKESDFNFIVNEALTDAKYANSKDVVVLRSMYDTELYGWIIPSSEINIKEDIDQESISNDNFITYNN